MSDAANLLDQVLIIDRVTGQGWVGRTKNFVSSLVTGRIFGGGGPSASSPATAATESAVDRITRAYSMKRQPAVGAGGGATSVAHLPAAAPRSWLFGFGSGNKVNPNSGANLQPDPRSRLPLVGRGGGATQASTGERSAAHAPAGGASSRATELPGSQSAPPLGGGSSSLHAALPPPTTGARILGRGMTWRDALRGKGQAAAAAAMAATADALGVDGSAGNGVDGAVAPQCALPPIVSPDVTSATGGAGGSWRDALPSRSKGSGATLAAGVSGV